MWHDVARCGMMWHDVARRRPAARGMMWHDMWHDVARCGTMWHDVGLLPEVGRSYYYAVCRARISPLNKSHRSYAGRRPRTPKLQLPTPPQNAWCRDQAECSGSDDSYAFFISHPNPQTRDAILPGLKWASPVTKHSMMCRRLRPRAHRLRRARGRRARALRARVHRHHVPLPLRRAGESCCVCCVVV